MALLKNERTQMINGLLMCIEGCCSLYEVSQNANQNTGSSLDALHDGPAGLPVGFPL